MKVKITRAIFLVVLGLILAIPVELGWAQQEGCSTSTKTSQVGSTPSAEQDTETPVRIKIDRSQPGYLKRQRKKQLLEGEKQSQAVKARVAATEKRIQQQLENDSRVREANAAAQEAQRRRHRGAGPEGIAQKDLFENEQKYLDAEKKAMENAERVRQEVEQELRNKNYGLKPADKKE